MVLPLVIGAAVVIGGLVLLTNSKVGEAALNITKSPGQKALETDIERYEHTKSKRGLWDNAYAFVFGEGALANTYQPGKTIPQPVAPGLPHETPAQNRFENYGTTRLAQKKKKATRYSDG